MTYRLSDKQLSELVCIISIPKIIETFPDYSPSSRTIYRRLGIGLFALGVFVGSLVWQFGLVFAATITSKFTNHKVQQEIQYSGALLILVLAIVLILW